MFLFRIVSLSKFGVFLLDIVTNKLKVEEKRTSTEKKFPQFSVSSLVRWYAIVMAIENTYGNQYTLLVTHFLAIKSNFEAKGISVGGLGYQHFVLILNALIPTKEEFKTICLFVSKAATSQISLVSQCTFDSL
jgi:hypothetical protein